MNKSNDNKATLFVWRDWLEMRYESIDAWKAGLVCIYCDTQLEEDDLVQSDPDWQDEPDDTLFLQAKCPLCGWTRRKWRSWHRGMDQSITSGRWITEKSLRQFELSDPRIALDELASHLQRHYSDVSLLSPRRFEELVTEIFKNMGWYTTLSQQSHDGGVDIYLVEKDGKGQAIVECKRFRNKVGIGIVDRLLGVQLAIGCRTAFLVTTSEFTSPARRRVESPNIVGSGFELTLIDASRLTEMLNVLNAELPPLHLNKRLLGEV